MRLNISSLIGRKGASFQVEKELSADFIQGLPEVGAVRSPIFAKLQVTNTGEGYLVTGDLSLEVELHCSRCLKPLKTTLETSIDEEYLNHPGQSQEDPLWDEQPLVDGIEVDTTSLIEESILVSIPMKPVCQEDCPGLCPGCGALLAEETCDCPDPTIDIRLAPLSKLLQQASETTTPERRKDHGSSKKKTFKSKS
ncbi:MAG TPA: DUF177 domain-containing protein [Limnochordia bacterium]|nr:DUF177 domain-containing protein [Limnochordia bacterium]